MARLEFKPARHRRNVFLAKAARRRGFVEAYDALEFLFRQCPIGFEHQGDRLFQVGARLFQRRALRVGAGLVYRAAVSFAGYSLDRADRAGALRSQHWVRIVQDGVLDCPVDGEGDLEFVPLILSVRAPVESRYGP